VPVPADCHDVVRAFSPCPAALLSIRVQTVHRRLNGACQSLLVTGSDGQLYALKMIHPAYTRSMRASEALAGLLASRIGLPVAEWRPMIVRDEVACWNPDFRFESAVGPVVPKADLSYGSRIVTAVDGEMPYEIIPRSWYAWIVNREDFVGMAIFDLWAHSLHHRQAAFAKVPEGLRAVFIDSCHAFGGPSGQKGLLPREVLYWDRRVYAGCWTEGVIERWVGAIKGICGAEVHALIDTLPSSWVTDTWRHGVATLLEHSRAVLSYTGAAVKGLESRS